MLSIIISPNRLPPPRITETIPTTNTRSNTSEKKKKKKIQPKLGGGGIGLVRAGTKKVNDRGSRVSLSARSG